MPRRWALVLPLALVPLLLTVVRADAQGLPTTTSSTTTTTAPTTTTTVKDNGNGGGCTRTYSIIGFGAFYLTGYHLSGSGWDAPSKAAAPCSGDERCIAGHFVQFVTSDALVGDGTTDFGLTAINLID